MKKLINFLFITIAAPSIAFVQVAPGGGHTAEKNVSIVYDSTTGQPIMVVVDAVDPANAAWNPKGSVRVQVDPALYNAQTPDSFQALITSLDPVSVAAAP